MHPSYWQKNPCLNWFLEVRKKILRTGTVGNYVRIVRWRSHPKHSKCRARVDSCVTLVRHECQATYMNMYQCPQVWGAQTIPYVGEDVRVLIFKILHAILHIIRAIPSSAGPPRLFGSPPTDLRARCGVEGTFTTKEGHSSHQKSDSIPIFYTRPRPPSRQQSRPLDPLFFCSSIYLIDNHHNGESTLLIRSYSSVS